MGMYAKTALKSFIECVESRKGGVLPCELNGLSVVSVEKEIGEFLREGGSGGKIFEDVGRLVEQCSGAGVVVCFGEIELFVGGNEEGVGFVVSQLTRLLGVHLGKVWLVGVAGTSEAYSKFLRLFPTVDKDWDLHLLTMTSATPFMEGLYPKSRWVSFSLSPFFIIASFSFLLSPFLYSLLFSSKLEPFCTIYLVYFGLGLGLINNNNKK